MNEQPPSTPEQEPAYQRPRIWIASLADYNAGRLHGEWVDADVEGDELVAEAQRIIESSREPGAEEWAIFDFDNFWSYRVGEYEDLHQVAAVARGIAEDGEAFAAYAQVSETRGDELEHGFIDAFVDSLLDDFDVADSIADALPEWLARHVDVDRDSLLRELLVDLQLESTSDGGIYLFRL